MAGLINACVSDATFIHHYVHCRMVVPASATCHRLSDGIESGSARTNHAGLADPDPTITQSINTPGLYFGRITMKGGHGAGNSISRNSGPIAIEFLSRVRPIAQVKTSFMISSQECFDLGHFGQLRGSLVIRVHLKIWSPINPESHHRPTSATVPAFGTRTVDAECKPQHNAYIATVILAYSNNAA